MPQDDFATLEAILERESTKKACYEINFAAGYLLRKDV